MSDTTYIVATLTPRAGKFDRLKELLDVMAKQVQDKEPDTYQYRINKSVDKEPPIIIMTETYKTEAHADEHVKTDHFNELVKSATDEELFAEAPNIMKCKAVGGFDSR